MAIVRIDAGTTGEARYTLRDNDGAVVNYRVCTCVDNATSAQVAAGATLQLTEYTP